MRVVGSLRERASAPPMMRSEGTPIHEVPGSWHLLHTRSRHDKALGWDLYRLELEYFLPLVRVQTTHAGRRVEVTKALFPGYVFVACATPEDRYRALSTHRVANVVDVADQALLKRELEQIRLAVNTPHAVDLYPGIRRGRRCRVIAGSLMGVEGVVVMRRTTGRVHLDVTMLGQSAVVEIDAMLLEPID